MAYIISKKKFDRIQKIDELIHQTGLTVDEIVEIVTERLDITPPLPMLFGEYEHVYSGLLTED